MNRSIPDLFLDKNNPHKIFECFTRQIFCDGEKISDQETFLKQLQLDGVGEWFDKCCFLSQDEHLQFLKEAKKSKARAISFLFEIPADWEKERKRLENILDVLNNRKKNVSYIKQVEKNEKELSEKVKDLEREIKSGEVYGSESYCCLFKEKNVYWDQENVRMNREEYEKASQEIDELLYFAEHREDCQNYLFNLPYQDYRKEFNGGEQISYKEYPLEYAYRFYSLVVNEQELEKRYAKNRKEQVLLECIHKKEYGDINWKFIDEEKFLDENEIMEIQEQLKNVKTLESVQGVLEKTMVSLKKTRADLIKYSKTAIQYNGIEDMKCPLCGAVYENWESLEAEIKKETNELNNISDDSVNQIQTIKEKLYDRFFAGIAEKIKENQQTAVSEKTYRKLQEVKKYKFQIIEVKNCLQQIGIFLPEIFQESISEINKGYNSLLKNLQEKLKKIPEEVELQLEGKKFID